MIKKIKLYFALRRIIIGEILETLCSICKWLEYDGHYSNNPYSKYLQMHYKALKSLSEEVRSKDKWI